MDDVDLARPLIQPETPISSEPRVLRDAPGQRYLLREEDTLVSHVKDALPDASDYLRIEYQREGPDSTSVTSKSEDAHLPPRVITVTIAQNEGTCQRAYLDPHEFSKAYFNSFQPEDAREWPRR